MRTLAEQLAEIREKTYSYSMKSGKDFAEKSLSNASELGLWIHYLKTKNINSIAIDLLSGAYASIVEASGYISLGLGRATILSIRTQIDLVIGFTYFCDHPREWERIEQTGEGFKLRSEIQKYHCDVIPNFKQRLGLIEQVSEYGLEEAYRILSAHIHGQSPFTIPKFDHMDDLVMQDAFILSLVEMQKITSLTLSNYLFSLYADDWPSIPEEITIRIRNILTDPQKRLFFKS